ncbi:hypothetical protein [Synechococcus sp. UW140]|uniref:hypothetical protein n=1 Tax=Synechococcus sp. UW140 TaxID=368503 RepID=UPI0010BD4C4D|nr:hypothetical protein [Synechococcus sp. UW140]
MQAISNTTQTKQSTAPKTYRPDFVFVVQLHSGKFVIGQANNPSKRIAAINSGLNPSVKGTLQINNIVGIKEQTEQRSLISVVNMFVNKYGVDNVITV